MQDLRYRYHVAPTAAEEGALQGGFTTGRVAMQINGTWMMAFHKEIQDFEWDIQYIPQGTRRAVSYAVGGWGVIKSSKHPEEAMRVALFWGGPVFQIENCIKLGLVTPLTRELAYSQDFLTLQGQAPPNHKIRMDGLDGSHFRSLVHVKGPEIMDLFRKETENLLMNKLTPDEFVRTVGPKADALLAQK
jgi:ABC-type glycerol-3-phosphate transport system substrate-binding protein